MTDYTPTEASAYIVIAAIMAVCLYAVVYCGIHWQTIVEMVG